MAGSTGCGLGPTRQCPATVPEGVSSAHSTPLYTTNDHMTTALIQVSKGTKHLPPPNTTPWNQQI